MFESDEIGTGGKKNPPNPRVVTYFKRFLDFFADFTLQEPEFICADRFNLACAIVAAARKQMHVSPTWSPDLELLTGVRFLSMLPLLELIDSKYRAQFPAAGKT